MKAGFYPRLARDGIRKNRRLYLPYLLTCIGTVMMFYLVAFLSGSGTVASLKGGRTITAMMGLGVWVLALFSLLFLFYSHSFLMRRRKREFGLYNVLGMGKRNIGRVLLWETLTVFGVSVSAGLLLGIGFSKLAELGLVNLIHGDVTFRITVSMRAVWLTVAVFGCIFLLQFLNGLRQIRFSGTMSLLRSENSGEKVPRANWVFAVLGVLILGGAYGIAVSVQNPVAALTLFFVAVLMVIVATYLLLISGSVTLCRALQKNKRYYYRPSHFVSVSSMVYRMKRNGAGLASVCVLATMVLVMVSTTISLYAGLEDSLAARYPREVNLVFSSYTDTSVLRKEEAETLYARVKASMEEAGGTVKDVRALRFAQVSAVRRGTELRFPAEESLEVLPDSLCALYLIPVEDYNTLCGQNVTLGGEEALVYAYRTSWEGAEISLNGIVYSVRDTVKKFTVSGDVSASVYPCLVLVVQDVEAALEPFEEEVNRADFRLAYELDFDCGLSDSALEPTIRRNRDVWLEDRNLGISWECRELNRADFYGMYGGLLYLGVILSVVFLAAVVLLLYYKQITEGYEDQPRFAIMRNVGMTLPEIRRSIRSQMRTVFFLPLVGAGLHLVFAFPMVEKLLHLSGLTNTGLFAAVTAGCSLVFALFYLLTYRITSRSYYRIVSGGRERE